MGAFLSPTTALVEKFDFLDLQVWTIYSSCCQSPVGLQIRPEVGDERNLPLVEVQTTIF
jgi:hypothetical protein